MNPLKRRFNTLVLWIYIFSHSTVTIFASVKLLFAKLLTRSNLLKTIRYCEKIRDHLIPNNLLLFSNRTLPVKRSWPYPPLDFHINFLWMFIFFQCRKKISKKRWYEQTLISLTDRKVSSLFTCRWPIRKFLYFLHVVDQSESFFTFYMSLTSQKDDSLFTCH